METLKQRIAESLAQEDIEVVRFDLGSASEFDLLDATAAELMVKVNDADKGKWDYFNKRLNECGLVARPSYFDGMMKWTFQGTADEAGSAELSRGLTAFAQAVERKFFKVAPKVANFSILVKPTHRCNLDCKYCYDKPFRETIPEDMSMETLDRILKLISEYTQEIHWIWHGGEPTVVGTKWYHQAYEVIAKYPMLTFHFSLMSNGVNFNDEWKELFTKYKIESGMSYNAHHQAKLRVTSQTKHNEDADSKIQDKLAQTILEWNRSGKRVGVIDVITGMNYKDQIEIYKWYNENNIGVAMNHIFHTRQTEANELEVSARDYADEFLKYFKYWLHDQSCQINERSVDEALRMVIGSRKLTCTHQDCRHAWLGFNPRGEMFPCDRWLPERYKIGSVFNYEDVDSIFKSQPYQMYCAEIDQRFETHCKPCGLWDICRGGCNASAVESSGHAAGIEPFFCQLMRHKFQGVYEILRDVDLIHDQNLNPKARQIMISEGFYSIKEIKDFLKEIGKDFPMEYDPDSLMECSEFQVFRGINYVKDGNWQYGRHIDLTDSVTDPAIVRRNEEARRKDLLDYLKGVAKDAISQT